MPVEFSRRSLGDGVYFTSVIDPRFKTNRISVHLVLPLKPEDVSKNALLPFLVKKGNKTYPDYIELNRHLSSLYGANLSADIQRIGDFQILSFSISTIDDKFALDGEPLVKELCDMMCGLLLEPAFLDESFSPSAFEVEKQGLIDTIEAEINEKTTFAVLRLLELMCADEPFGLNKYGKIDEIRQLTLPQIREKYSKVLSSARIECFFIGCGNAETASALFSSRFSLLDRNPFDSLTSLWIPSAQQQRVVTEHYQVAQAKIVMGFRVNAPEVTQREAARVMSAIFGGTPRSLLFMNVREKLSLCYYCSSRYDSKKNIMLVNSGVEFENIEKAKSEILHQLDLLQKGEFTDQLLDETKRMIESSFQTVNDSTSAVESWYLGQLFESEILSPEQQAQRLLSVTRDQVIEAAKAVSLDMAYILTGEEANG